MLDLASLHDLVIAKYVFQKRYEQLITYKAEYTSLKCILLGRSSLL